jgi:hypothetical protein
MRYFCVRLDPSNQRAKQHVRYHFYQSGWSSARNPEASLQSPTDSRPHLFKPCFIQPTLEVPLSPSFANGYCRKNQRHIVRPQDNIDKVSLGECDLMDSGGEDLSA